MDPLGAPRRKAMAVIVAPPAPSAATSAPAASRIRSRSNLAGLGISVLGYVARAAAASLLHPAGWTEIEIFF